MKKNRSDSATGEIKTSYYVMDEDHPPTKIELSVLELKRRRHNAILQERVRLSGISGRTAIIFALFIAVIKLAERHFPPFGELIGAHSFRGQAALILLIVGIVPHIASVLIILLERPSAKFVYGEKPSLIACLLAFLSGFPLIFFVLTVEQLFALLLLDETLVNTTGWNLLNQGIFLFQSSGVQIALTVLIACLIPALGQTLLINGLIQSGLSSEPYQYRALFSTSLFASLTALDLRSVPQLLIIFTFVCKIRNDSDSLLPAALVNFSVSLGRLIYPAIYQFTADLLWGQLPGSTGQIISQALPLILFSAMLVLPALIFFTNVRNRTLAEERELSQQNAANNEMETVGPGKYKTDYLFVAANIILFSVLILQDLV
ncbi:MAG: hypothetical protein ACOX3P_05660 [Saccharofermentanales bacterium]|nr:hypothetical protein [Bacillota bacterium]